jgi:hypothetical protein
VFGKTTTVHSLSAIAVPHARKSAKALMGRVFFDFCPSAGWPRALSAIAQTALKTVGNNTSRPARQNAAR